LMIRIEDRNTKMGAAQKHIIGGLLQDVSVSGCCTSVQRPAHELCPGTAVRLEFELLGIGHISNLNGIVKNVSEHLTHTEIGVEFLFNGTEFIEYRGWGGSVQKALEFFVMQKQPVDKL
ncbi:MAG: PilZ domain-containing protein, partial [Nitrospiraceae bacterium]